MNIEELISFEENKRIIRDQSNKELSNQIIVDQIVHKNQKLKKIFMDIISFFLQKNQIMNHLKRALLMKKRY